MLICSTFNSRRICSKMRYDTVQHGTYVQTYGTMRTNGRVGYGMVNRTMLSSIKHTNLLIPAHNFQSTV